MKENKLEKYVKEMSVKEKSVNISPSTPSNDELEKIETQNLVEKYQK